MSEFVCFDLRTTDADGAAIADPTGLRTRFASRPARRRA